MIDLKNVEYVVETGAYSTWLLRRVDLHIAAGEFVTIMGPSGAGKSTLLNVLGLLDDHWTGEYSLNTTQMGLCSRKERAHIARTMIGVVFQSYHLLDDLTVAENLALPLTYKNYPRQQQQSLVADTLDRFHIVGKKDLYPAQLSGGQQQLVGIARAVIHRPTLLLADEPTGNLHSEQADQIMKLFCQLNDEGTTVIQVTHSEHNSTFGSRTVQLRDGWLVADTARPSLQTIGVIR